VTLSAEQTARLAQRAAAAGVQPEQYLISLI
jgi:hypothetical protein